MNEKTVEAYRAEMDPETTRYWMREGPRTESFLLVIPGCAIVGYGIGLLAMRALPYSLIGFGGGLLHWGLIVAFGR